MYHKVADTCTAPPMQVESQHSSFRVSLSPATPSHNRSQASGASRSPKCSQGSNVSQHATAKDKVSTLASPACQAAAPHRLCANGNAQSELSAAMNSRDGADGAAALDGSADYSGILLDPEAVQQLASPVGAATSRKDLHLKSFVGGPNSPQSFSPLAQSALARDSAWVLLNYGVTAEQGTRRTMEDQHTMLAEGIPFFGVYDGHGGTQCAEYLRDNLHTLILSHPDIRTNPEKAIKDGIIEADRGFLEKCATEHIESGSVCAVCLFVRGRLVVGNVGDCEAVLCRNGNPMVLTVSHNPRKNAREERRVVDAGGRVVNHRVGHPCFNPAAISLAVSRAIGDVGFKSEEYTSGKPSGVIAVPDTVSIKLTSEDEFLIIGCDGLWDVMTHAEVVKFCKELLDKGVLPNDITERLVSEALSKGTTDNVTVAFISCQTTGCAVASSPQMPDLQRVSSVSSTSAMLSMRGTTPLCPSGFAGDST